jgi:hypothetical protein
VKFVDKSLAEFFAAQYFIDKILKSEISDENWRLFGQARKFKTWSVVRRFLVDFMAVNREKLNEGRMARVREIVGG